MFLLRSISILFSSNSKFCIRSIIGFVIAFGTTISLREAVSVTFRGRRATTNDFNRNSCSLGFICEARERLNAVFPSKESTTLSRGWNNADYPFVLLCKNKTRTTERNNKEYAIMGAIYGGAIEHRVLSSSANRLLGAPKESAIKRITKLITAERCLGCCIVLLQ